MDKPWRHPRWVFRALLFLIVTTTTIGQYDFVDKRLRFEDNSAINRFIVVFRRYMVDAERWGVIKQCLQDEEDCSRPCPPPIFPAALHGAPENHFFDDDLRACGSCGASQSWSIKRRHNAASTFPSDFDILCISNTSAMPSFRKRLLSHPLVKSFHVDKRLSRKLQMYKKTYGKNNEESLWNVKDRAGGGADGSKGDETRNNTFEQESYRYRHSGRRLTKWSWENEVITWIGTVRGEKIYLNGRWEGK